MRLSLWTLLILAAAGCASTESQSPPAARQVPVDSKNVVDVQRAGYKLVNRDGEKLYCRRELETGSHLVDFDVCHGNPWIPSLGGADARRSASAARGIRRP